MPALNSQVVVSSLILLLASQLLLLPTTVGGFQSRCASQPPSTTATSLRVGTILFNSQEDDQDDDSPLSVPLSKPSSSLEEGTFNPFDYQRGTKRAGSTPPRVDLRSMRMSSLTGDLLDSLGDNVAMRTILEDNRDFLLEPLEVADSLAASGSTIYTPNMTRSERYQAYKRSVEERLKSSKSPKAKAVLTAMKDYVLEFEDEGPV